MEKGKYLLSDIVIEGMEPSAEYQELLEKEKRGEITTEELGEILKRPHTVVSKAKPNIFEYFETVGDWGKWHKSIFKALTEISNIEKLPNNFSVDYIKYKEGVGIRIEYENAGDRANLVNEILRRLESETV